MNLRPLLATLPLTLSLAAYPAFAQTYTFKDLGTPTARASFANAINEQDWVVDSEGAGYDARVMLWHGKRAVDISRPGNACWANSINRHEHVVGSCMNQARGSYAVKWVDRQVIELEAIENAMTIAADINEDDVIVGYAVYNSGIRHAYKWTSTGAIHLEGLYPPRSISLAMAINQRGTVVGMGENANGDNIALKWAADAVTPTRLPWTGAGWSYLAYGINRHGQIVGSGYDNFRQVPARWDGNVVRRLPVIGGGSATALAINSAGVAVGTGALDWPHDDEDRALMWPGDDTVVDLNDRLDEAARIGGWVMSVAYGINDKGQIVGFATSRLTGVRHAFLLTPVGLNREVTRGRTAAAQSLEPSGRQGAIQRARAHGTQRWAAARHLARPRRGGGCRRRRIQSPAGRANRRAADRGSASIATSPARHRATPFCDARAGCQAVSGWLLHRVRPMFDQRILEVSEDVMFKWRLLVEEGRKAGHTFSQPDLIIAATALQHGLTVVTRDTGDYKLARVPLLNPWVDEPS